MMQQPKLKKLRCQSHTAAASISQSWTNAREDINPKPVKKKRSPVPHNSRAITCPARQAFYENLIEETRRTKKPVVRKVYSSRGPSPSRYLKCTRSWSKPLRQRSRNISPNARGTKVIPPNIGSPLKYPTSVLVSSNQIGRDSFSGFDTRRRSVTSHHVNDMFLSEAPHLKYGMFGNKRGGPSKSKIQSNRAITVKTSQKTTVMAPPDHPNTVKRDRRKLSRKESGSFDFHPCYVTRSGLSLEESLTPAPMFVFRTIDKRVTKQLGFSEIMHLDVRPLKNPPMSPYRNLSPVPYQMLPQTPAHKSISAYKPAMPPYSRIAYDNSPPLTRPDEPIETKASRGSKDKVTQKSNQPSFHHMKEDLERHIRRRNKPKLVTEYGHHFPNFKDGVANVLD